MVANRGDLRGPDGLPIWKPPYSLIIAIDMATGEFLCEIPNGDMPEYIRNHPALRGLDLLLTGQMGHAAMLLTRTLLVTAPGGHPAPTRWTRRRDAASALSNCRRQGNTASWATWTGARQDIVVQVGSPTHPGSLVALRLKN